MRTYTHTHTNAYTHPCSPEQNHITHDAEAQNNVKTSEENRNSAQSRTYELKKFTSHALTCLIDKFLNTFLDCTCVRVRASLPVCVFLFVFACLCVRASVRLCFSPSLSHGFSLPRFVYIHACRYAWMCVHYISSHTYMSVCVHVHGCAVCVCVCE